MIICYICGMKVSDRIFRLAKAEAAKYGYECVDFDRQYEGAVIFHVYHPMDKGLRLGLPHFVSVKNDNAVMLSHEEVRKILTS